MMSERTLLKSWATPLASRPTPSIFWAWRNRPSSALRSVTSWWEPVMRTGRPEASRIAIPRETIQR